MSDEIALQALKEISKVTGKSCICFNLRKTSRLLSQVYDQALKFTGVKVTQFSLMMAIAGDSGTTIGKLAYPLGMDRTTLSRNAKILENKGLILIEEGDDRREQRLKLTDEGIALLLEVLPIWEEVQKKLTENMGEERLKALLRDLRDLVHSPSRSKSN